MKIDLFDYELPEELIARYPAQERSGSRLLVLERRTGEIRHRQFSDLPALLRPGDLVVANRTRVFPARVFAKKQTGGEVELLLLERLGEGGPGERWRALARGAKKLRRGQVLAAEGATLHVEEREGEKIGVRIETSAGEDVLDWADRVGELPLPPYLKRAVERSDAERYQTVFAAERGSVAAPTAGLHFDDALIAALRKKEILFETLRLDVGWGTFAPIRADDVREHRLDAEFYEISPELAEKIAARRADPRVGRTVAVGTTTTRSLEEAFGADPPALSGRAGLYITPGYEFRAVDALVTNFHLPRTSLLVLVCAFAGREHVLAAYREAVRERYRFYSYGDAMLIV